MTPMFYFLQETDPGSTYLQPSTNSDWSCVEICFKAVLFLTPNNLKSWYVTIWAYQSASATGDIRRLVTSEPKDRRKSTKPKPPKNIKHQSKHQTAAAWEKNLPVRNLSCKKSLNRVTAGSCVLIFQIFMKTAVQILAMPWVVYKFSEFSRVK